jgi:hypothetical protein
MYVYRGTAYSFRWDYPPTHHNINIKKKSLSLNRGGFKPCKASSFAIGQHLRTFVQVERKRLRASGCFGLVRVRIKAIFWGELEGIIPTLKQTNPPKQQHPHQPEEINTSNTHKIE